jgi:4-hydroxybenzoate polyprenyltransferase
MLLYLKLMRWQNLVLILLTQLVLLRATFAGNVYFKTLWKVEHVFFFLATLLIAAAGNILNDFMDADTDGINKPDKVIVDRAIPKIKVFGAYRVCFILGIILGEIAAFLLLNWELAIIFPLSAYLLQQYSIRFKGTVLLGNVIIAFLCALVPVTVYYFAIGCVGNYLMNAIQPMPDLLTAIHVPILFFYSLFAFLSTLFREIIKDIEDEDGDSQTGWHTLVVLHGEKTAKNVAALVGGISLCLILFFLQYSHFDTRTFFFANLLLILPLLVILFFLYFANQYSDYQRLSWMCKVWMLCGLIYVF